MTRRRIWKETEEEELWDDREKWWGLVAK